MPAPIEERIAVEDLVVAYCSAVDSMADPQAAVSLFTPKGLLDYSQAGIDVVQGHKALREFYTASFAATAHQAHFLTNFVLQSFGSGVAQAHANVQGHVRPRDGNPVVIYGRYYVDAVKIVGAWKIASLRLEVTLPLA